MAGEVKSFPGFNLEGQMKTIDKYGFTEDTETKLPARDSKDKIDPIGRYLRSPGYLSNHKISGRTFDRYYFADRFAMDIFKTDGVDVDKEIQAKKRLARQEKFKYYAVQKGTDFTSKELKRILKGV